MKTKKYKFRKQMIPSIREAVEGYRKEGVDYPYFLVGGSHEYLIPADTKDVSTQPARAVVTLLPDTKPLQNFYAGEDDYADSVAELERQWEEDYRIKVEDLPLYHLFGDKKEMNTWYSDFCAQNE